MRRVLSLFVLIFLLIICGCVNKSRVATIERINGEEVYILREEQPEVEPARKNLVTLDYYRRIGGVLDAFFLDNYNLLLIKRETDKEIGFFKFDLKTRKESKLIKWKKGKYFHLSPDRSRLMYIVLGKESGQPEIHILNIKKLVEGKGEASLTVAFPRDYLEKVDISWMGKKNDILFMSLCWADNETIMFSERDGNIYYKNIVRGSRHHYLELDSWFKLQLTKVGNKIIFIKNPGYKNLDLKINEPDYDNFIKKQKNNFLAFAEQDNQSDLIIERKKNLHIKDYRLSPDGNKLALYFEDNDNNGLLTVALVGTNLFNKDIKYQELYHISNELIYDFQWSPDSRYIAYSTSGTVPGLFIADTRGDFNRQLLIYKNFSRIEWQPEGKKLLALEKEDEINVLYEIKLLYKIIVERGAIFVE